MLENISKTTSTSAIETSTNSEENTDFTLVDHYEERIDFHMKMLNYYLNEKTNEIMAIRSGLISGNIIRD
jgi:hypothetical protein